jgi:hypothetical protein
MGFGMRTMVDYLPIFAYLFANIFRINSRYMLATTITVSVLSIIYVNILHYQYRKYILYWAMDKEMFWDVFLRTDRKYKGYLWSKQRTYTPDITTSELESKYIPTYHFYENFEDSVYTTAEFTYNGNGAINLANNEYCYLIHSTRRKLMPDSVSINYIKASAKVYQTKPPLENKFSLIIDFIRNDKKKRYVTYSESIDIPEGKWNTIDLIAPVPSMARYENTEIKVYIHLRGKYDMYIDDFRAHFLSPKKRTESLQSLEN